MRSAIPCRHALGLLVGAAAILAGCKPHSASPSCCSATEVSAAEPSALPGDSVWQLTSDWLDQDGTALRLDRLRGEVVVTAMIFTHCLYACPRLVADLKELERRLASREDSRQPRYLLVSMDHERDDPATLRAFAARHHLDPAHWTLLHGDAPQVREFAAVLGVKFRRAPNGDYAHSNQLAVLDRDGRIVHRQHGLQADPTATLQVLADLLEN